MADATIAKMLDDIQERIHADGRGGDPPRPPTRRGDGGGDSIGPMDARLTALETLMPTLATKADMADVRTDIQKGVNETHRWMLGTVIGLFFGFGALFLAMSNALRPSSPAAQAPIIINVPTPAAPASK